MVKRQKTFTILIITMVLIGAFFSINVSAIKIDAINSVEILREEELPENFNFIVSDKCTHHNFFEQATAREDGSFATCTNGVVVDGVRSDTNKEFIDIYDADGKFIEELRFETSSAVAIELTQTTLNIFLYSEVICYDLRSKDVKYYITPEYEAYTSDYVQNLRKDKFTVGEWTYKYKGTIFGHTRLIRSNGTQKQILVEMEGTDNPNIVHAVVGGIIFATSGRIYIVYKCKKRR